MMKLCVKMLSLLLIVTLLFAGCKGGEMDIRGSFAPLNSAASPEDEIFYGGTYTNEFFGFRGVFSAIWEIENPEKVQEKYAHSAISGKSEHKHFSLSIVDTSRSLADGPQEIFKSYMDGIVKNNPIYFDGDYFNHEFNFLGKKCKGILVRTLPEEENECKTTFAHIQLHYNKYTIIIDLDFCNEYGTPEVMQLFLDECFTPLDNSVVWG